MPLQKLWGGHGLCFASPAHLSCVHPCCFCSSCVSCAAGAARHTCIMHGTQQRAEALKQNSTFFGCFLCLRPGLVALSASSSLLLPKVRPLSIGSWLDESVQAVTEEEQRSACQMLQTRGKHCTHRCSDQCQLWCQLCHALTRTDKIAPLVQVLLSRLPDRDSRHWRTVLWCCTARTPRSGFCMSEQLREAEFCLGKRPVKCCTVHNRSPEEDPLLSEQNSSGPFRQ
jgi:hypothetical protein